MTNGHTDAVLYLVTNTGLAENTDYVLETCRDFGWPCLVYPAPMSLARFAMTYGFPGSAFHTVAYIYFKERQLQYLAGSKSGKPHYYTGVRTDESDRRAKTIADEPVVEARQWYWHAPIREWTNDDVAEYRRRHNLPPNPVTDTIHRSGDCYCGAYAHRDELLVDLRAGEYDAHAEWVHDVERAVQAYRGRVDFFKTEYPEKADLADAYRDRHSPKPMRLPVYRDLFPAEATVVDELPRERAIARGQRNERNFWGHASMSNDEITALLADHDDRQYSLCRFCPDG